ncbi:MAG TPA: TadE/TadG family type IV pilus assembly protein [Streptosporangiaceae bacterium]|jgi:Flp pilus assembly protein TadG
MRLTFRDRGSMTLEFALLAPAFILLVLLLVVGGRIVEAQSQVDGAARDAARAASVQVFADNLHPAIEQAAQSDLDSAGHDMCPGGLSETWAGGSAAGEVTVNVHCTINLSFFPGLGTLTMTGHALAPLDTYVERVGW